MYCRKAREYWLAGDALPRSKLGAARGDAVFVIARSPATTQSRFSGRLDEALRHTWWSPEASHQNDV
jgi:hypothetical protein